MNEQQPDTSFLQTKENQDILFRVNQKITASLDPEQVCAAIHWAASQLMPTEAFVITLLDQARQEIELIYALDQGRRAPDQRIPAHRGLSGHVIATGEPLCIDDTSQITDMDTVHFGEPEYVRSVLAVPMRLGGRVIGMLSAQSYQPNTYTLDDQQTLSLLGNQAAIALENARLFEAKQRQLEELTVLHAIAAASAEAVNADELIERASQVIGETLYPDNLGVLLLDEVAGVLRIHPSYRGYGEAKDRTIPIGQGITGQVTADGQPRRVPDVTRVPGYIAANQQTRSELCVPLRVGERIIGVINAESAQLDAFSAADERLLVTVAGQLATAIEKIRLFEAERRRRQEAETLREATTALTAALDLDQVLENILIYLERVLPYDSATVFLLDGAQLRVMAARGFLRAEHLVGQAFPASNPLFHEMQRTREPIWLTDAQTDPRFEYWGDSSHVRGWMGTPLIVRGEVIGYLTVDSRRVAAYGETEIALARAFANQAAVAIQNARLFAQTGEALAREQSLNEIAHAVSGALDLATILPNIVRLAVELVGADAGSLALASPDNETISYPYSFNLPQGVERLPLFNERGLALQVIESRKSVLLLNYPSHPQASASWIEVGASSMIVVPLIAGEMCLGALGLFSLDVKKRFTERDQALAESVGRQAGVAIQNARLFAETQRRAEELADTLSRQKELDHLKSEFIQNASHELRTPLAIIRGYTELLEKGDLGEPQSDQHDALTIIARRARMLSRLMADFTTILSAETRELKQEFVDLTALVHALLADFRVSTEDAGLTLTAEVTPDPLLALGNPAHLERVLDNLLMNAVKFTPFGGQITARLWSEGPNAILEIEDTGVGIAADQLERIFERFYQVDGSMSRRYGGSGLGLALVKEVVEAHDGQVTVESNLGEGSTFRIILPCATAA